MARKGSNLNNDWWWPDDSEKLSKAMKEMGCTALKRGDEDMEFAEWLSSLRRVRVRLPDLQITVGRFRFSTAFTARCRVLY